MSDNKNKKGPIDRSKISTKESYEVRYWCNKWNISHRQLTSAIKATGSHAVKKIEKYLRCKEII
jgi:hypothetical protein